MRMLFENALAVGIEFFGDGADGGFLSFVGDGEWEGVEAARIIVAWIIPNAEPSPGYDRK